MDKLLIQIEFTPSLTGDYKICLKLQLSREKNEIYTGNNKKFAKISFKLYLGDDLSFYREKLELEQLTDLQAKTELLISNVRKIEKYQLMFRQNQEKFRDRAADVNNAVFWWGIFQVSGSSLILLSKDKYLFFIKHFISYSTFILQFNF